ncbi:MAG TPA: hypothetical protein DCX28_04895, partial [Enterobacteriaceae bacterium]|nr:hypothetical protein [Enterobacteriaceae bacterium]
FLLNRSSDLPARRTQSTSNCAPNLPVLFRGAAALAALVHPKSLTHVSSWGFTSLPPCRTAKQLG